MTLSCVLKRLKRWNLSAGIGILQVWLSQNLLILKFVARDWTFVQVFIAGNIFKNRKKQLMKF